MISLSNGNVSPEIAQAAAPVTTGGLSALQNASAPLQTQTPPTSDNSGAFPDNTVLGGANALNLPPPPPRGGISEDLRTQMMRAANTAAQNNPNPNSPSAWARNLLAGAQTALAGVGAVGKVPEGAGGLYGAGKAMQYAVEQRQKAQEAAALQKQRDQENARQNALAQSEIQKNQATTAHENVQAMWESRAHAQLDEAANQALIEKGQKELTDDLAGDAPPPVILKDATSGEIMKAIQNKTVDPTKMHRILTGQKEVGERPDGTPIMENVYTIEGQGGPVKVSSDFAKAYKDAFPNKPEITEGTELPWVDYKYQKQLVSNVETAKEIQKDNERKLGIEKEGEETTAETNALQQDPRFLKFMGATGLNGPAAFQAAQADPQMVKDYPRMLKDFQGAVGTQVWDEQVKAAAKNHEDASDMLKKIQDDPGLLAGDKAAAYVATAKARLADPLTPADQRQALTSVLNQAQAAETETKNAKAGSDIQGPEGDLKLTGDDYLATLPAGHQALVRQLGDGQMSLQDIQRALNKEPYLLDEAAIYAPGFNSAKVRGYISTYKDFDSGKSKDQIQSINTMLPHLDRLLTHLNQNPTGVLPYVGSVESYLGNKSAAQIDTDRKQASTELAAAYARGAVTDQENKKYSEELQTTSPFKLRNAVKEITALLESKLDGLKFTWDTAAPSDKFNPPRPIISPIAQRALDRINGDKNLSDWSYTDAAGKKHTYSTLDDLHAAQNGGVVPSPQSQFSLPLPDGTTAHFQTQQQLDQFKQALAQHQAGANQ